MGKYIFGVSIGLIVALIIVLILHFTAFKNKNMGLLYFFIFIIFAIAGGFIQYHFFYLKSIAPPTPQEQIDSITTTIEDNWKNTNGGFTFEQIHKSQNDDECPTYSDQIIDLTCYDFGGYVVFSFKDNNVYQNALFYKSSNGLILDGMINTTATYDTDWLLRLKTDTFKWKFELDEEPYYKYVNQWWWFYTYDNMVSVSRQTADFVENLTRDFIWNVSNGTNYALKQAALLTATNVTSHFIRFGDAELIGSADSGYIKINSFYNYLYEQIKGQNYNTSKIIDATASLCVPIPSDLQQNYPISSDKKADYDNADFYGVYRCGIAVDLTYTLGNKVVSSTTKNEEYIDTLEKDDNYKNQVQVDQVNKNCEYSKVNLQFIESQDSDLSNINLSLTPIKITFNCNELSSSKTIIIDSLDKLNSGLTILLNKNATWTYIIESEKLIFENFRGSFVLNSEKTSLSFSYYYLDNYTIVSVGLNPVGTIDTAVIDLVKNPVRIILSNDNNTYQFVFNSNTQLDTYQSMLVEMGTYTYTILSEQLVFVSVNGTLTITTTDKVMLFNYALKVDQPLTFDVEMTNNSSYIGSIHLHSDINYVTMIRDTLPSNKTYVVNCYIYDNEGKLVQSFSHTHSSTGVCSDTWKPTLLTSGETYTAQLRFSSSADESITYLSDICTFTYNSTQGYQLSYTTTKN